MDRIDKKPIQNFTCFQGRYYVKDMIVDTSLFPPFVPIGDYRLDYTYYTLLNGKKEFLLFLQDYWNIKPLGAIEF